jgi:hypothetical protein
LKRKTNLSAIAGSEKLELTPNILIGMNSMIEIVLMGKKMMIKKNSGCLQTCLRSWVKSFRLIILTILTFLFNTGFSYAKTDVYPFGKQGGKLETWAFHSKIDFPEKKGALYLGMFFCSGTLYFLKGNFAHIFWMDTSTGEFKYVNNVFIPPFEKVVHSEKNLDEKYHGSFFRYNAIDQSFLASANLKKFCAELSFFPEKPSFDYDQVCQLDSEAKMSDWYMFPRMNINASVNGEYDLTASGQGHFQHFWGEEINESGDFVVAHLESGYDIVINEISIPEENTSLPDEVYILISDPDGNVERISSFDYSVLEWAKSGKKGKEYPVHISIKSNDRNLNLDVRVFKDDQTANLLGTEKWFGYADVRGHLDNKPQSGWAFFSPIGKKEK